MTKAGEVKSGTAPSAAMPNAANRLIVRNLPFDATEQDLRAVFLPYGPIYSIHIPIDKDGAEEEGGETSQGGLSPKKKGRSKGFAFVWMLSKKDAEKAIEGCNGTMMRGGMAESLVSDKQKRKKQRRLDKKLKAAVAGAKGEGEDGDEVQEAEDIDDDGVVTERVIAVDWALSKERWEEEKAKIGREREGDDDVEMQDVSASEDDDDDESEADGENLGVHEEGSEGSDDDEEDVNRDEDVEEPVKPTLPPPETGTTLFIRNVPFDATEDELRTLYVFRSFP